MRHILWVADTHHGNQPVQPQHVPSYADRRQIQSATPTAITADISLNLDVGADMHKDRMPKTSPWVALINISAAA